MTATTREPLSLPEAQRIAESIVGAVSWNGAEGHCACPGTAKHTTHTAPTDCKVVCDCIGELKPGVYCFHDSCLAETEAASFALRSALGKRSPSSAPIVRTALAMPRPRPKFDPEKLARIAAKLDGIDQAWFAAAEREEQAAQHRADALLRETPQLELTKRFMAAGPRARREFLADVKAAEPHLFREIMEGGTT